MRSGLRQLVQDVTYKGGQVVADSANAIIPHRTGAVDVMVVEQPDGSIRASPFYVRFGKYAALVGNREVYIEVNGHRLDFTMTLERYGTAYFCREIPNIQEDNEDYDDATLTGMMSPSSGYASGDESPFTQLVPTALQQDSSKLTNSTKKFDSLVLPKRSKFVRRTVSSIETQWSTNLDNVQPKFFRSDSFPNRKHGRTRSLEYYFQQQLLEEPIEEGMDVRPKSARMFNEHLHRVNTGLSDKSEDEEKKEGRRPISASPSFEHLQQLKTQRKKVFSSAPYLGMSPPLSPRYFGRHSIDVTDLKDMHKESHTRVRFQDSEKSPQDSEQITSFQGFENLAGSTDDTSKVQFPKPPATPTHTPEVSFNELPQPPTPQKIPQSPNNNTQNNQQQQNGILQNNQKEIQQEKIQKNRQVDLSSFKSTNSTFKTMFSGPLNEDDFDNAYNVDNANNVDIIDNAADIVQQARSEDQDTQDVVSRPITQLSRCWGDMLEIAKMLSEEGDVEKQMQSSIQETKAAMLKVFESKAGEEQEFLDNMQEIIQDPNLAVRIGVYIYQFKDVLPVLVAASVFSLDPDKALQSINNQNIKYFEIGSEEQTVKLKLKDRSLSWTSYILSFLNKKDQQNNGDERPRRKVVQPTEEQLQQFAKYLHDGSNKLEYIHSTEKISCHIYKVKWDQKLVVSDVDGTITISDVLGHVLPAIGWDWFQPGICQLFTNIRSNGYHMMYLSSRAIAQALQTREMLYSIEQEGTKIPQGPVVISPEGILPSLYREVIQRRPHEFKIKALMDIRRLFPEDINPFFAGFGNRDTDEKSYAEVGIPPSMIFTINPKGHIKRVLQSDPNEDLNLTLLNNSVEQLFPYIGSTIMSQESYDKNNTAGGRISLDNPSDVFEEVIDDDSTVHEMEAVLTPYSPI